MHGPTPSAAPHVHRAFGLEGPVPEPDVIAVPEECRLLLCAAADWTDSGRMAQARRLLAQPVRWERLFAMAESHGLMPLLHGCVAASTAPGVPESAAQVLAEHYAASRLRTRMLVLELLELLDHLRGHDIPAVPYKGPVLGVVAYRDLALRPFGDLDILIRERDVARACSLLAQLGYRRVIPELHEAAERYFVRVDHEHEFFSTDGLTSVDLHWRLCTRRFPARIDTEAVWSRLGTCDILEHAVPTLDPEDQLLAHCMHANKDLWRKLIWLSDIDKLIRATEPLFDWDRMRAAARRAHCARMLDFALYLAHHLLATPLPPAVQRTLTEAPRNAVLAREIVPTLFSSSEERNRTGDPWSRIGAHGFHLRISDSTRDRLGYVLRTLTTPNEGDLMATHLPASLLFLLRPMRPFQLMRRCILGGLRQRKSAGS